jgi:hypothetical protein
LTSISPVSFAGTSCIDKVRPNVQPAVWNLLERAKLLTDLLIEEADDEWADLFNRVDRSHHGHSLVSWTSLIKGASMTDSTFGNDAGGTIYLEWTPAWVGAIVAAALSFVLLAFGSALGLAVASPSSSWRDTSAIFTLLSGLWLLLTALASFGLGGYLAGRLRIPLRPHSPEGVRRNTRAFGLGNSGSHRRGSCGRRKQCGQRPARNGREIFDCLNC